MHTFYAVLGSVAYDKLPDCERRRFTHAAPDDVLFFSDADCTEYACRIPGHYSNCPYTGKKRMVLKGNHVRLVWPPQFTPYHCPAGLCSYQP